MAIDGGGREPASVLSKIATMNWLVLGWCGR